MEKNDMFAKLASERYVERRFEQEVFSKTFMSIDSENGQFMLPIRKVDGVQHYMRMTIVSVDGVWSVDLDQKFYVKNEDDSYTEVK